MSGREAVRGAVVAVDLELLRAGHTLEEREALQRHLRGAGDELEEARAVRLVEGTQRAPEPLDLEHRRRRHAD